MKLLLKAFVVLTLLAVTFPLNAQADDFSDADLLQLQVTQADRLPIAIDKSSSQRINTATAHSKVTYGTYPYRKGVILVTPDSYKNLIPTGHAGIIYSAHQTIESVATGVRRLNNNWHSTKSQAYAVTVTGLSIAQDAQAADWVNQQLGKPYNFNYLNRNTREQFYCSQLVWAAFKDNYNVDLDTSDWGWAVHPMELVKSSNTTLIWRKQ